MNNRNEIRRGSGYLNGVLTVIAGLLVVIALKQYVGGGVGEAVAGSVGEPGGMGIPNAAAQRRDMIRAIDRVDARLKRVEQALGGTLRVDVVTMPAIEVREK